MTSPSNPLAPFHPLVAAWFAETYGSPTDVQARAWPAIARGEHVLACAPTGSGKTLAAFLWALNELLTGAWPPGGIRLLYVSPLKALNTDIRLNLLGPLAALAARFKAAGLTPPVVNVLTRSGDTPPAERQRMRKRPPEILVTTPESLNILLTSLGGKALLGGVRSIILDEIHAVAGNKRGTHLMTGVERLTLLSGEVQRLALSATLRPLTRVAELVGGWTADSAPGELRRRPMTIVAASDRKRLDLHVAFPVDAHAGPGSVWPGLVRACRERIAAHRSTLLFTNSRRMAEKVSRLLNEDAPAPLAYSHHGSLSREVRRVVEERLKAGELPAIVATSSLELGIDIGPLDLVLLVQTPRTVASALQRLGRAGHQVGSVSHGELFATHARDLRDAAAMARVVLDGDVEEAVPPKAPLDVLAQVILSMTATETWKVDALFDFLRRAEPYHELSRRQFDLVLQMLAGRYADTRLTALAPRLSLDQIDGTVRAKDGAARLIYKAGGTIVDRGYYTMRVADSGARLGELDEEFVWERRVGDTFLFGAQCWRVTEITANDLRVAPAAPRAAMAPFWRAEEQHRSFHFASHVAELHRRAESLLERDPTGRALTDELTARYVMEPEAALHLRDFLERQRRVTERPLPHRHHLLVEHVRDLKTAEGAAQTILHTLWGGRVNRTLALALSTAWAERYGTPAEIVHEDDCVLITGPRELTAAELFALVPVERVDALVTRGLETTGLFGAHFREAAARALLLPKGSMHTRMPLWKSRLFAKRLLAAVSGYGDFPMIAEAWRSTLEEVLDLGQLKALLLELRQGQIKVSEAHTREPSPLAAQVTWRQTNASMYQDDQPVDGGKARLRPDLIAELTRSSALRPGIPEAERRALELKLQRTAPGYAPRSAVELLDWVKERVLLSHDEWRALLAAIERDHGDESTTWVDELRGKLAELTLGDAGGRVVAIERLPALGEALGLGELPESLRDVTTGAPLDDDQHRNLAAARRAWARQEQAGDVHAELADLVAEWLRAFGPIDPEHVSRTWGLTPAHTAAVIDALVAEDRVVVDRLSETATDAELCDLENLEHLLRRMRARSRPAVATRPAAHLQLFLATWQGLTRPPENGNSLRSVLEQLFGFPAPAAAWETELLPARLPGYSPAALDQLLQESDLLWLGCGPKRLTFVLADDLSLVGPKTGPKLPSLFPGPTGRFTLPELATHARLSTSDATRELWQLAWRGGVTNDSFAAIRQGLLSGFAPAEAEPVRFGRRRSSARAFDRWARTRAFAGHWWPVPWPSGDDEPVDALDLEELGRDRARLLLGRYGILCRELLEHELSPLKFGAVFRALRLMELSGEVLSGHFFAGLGGPQFLSPAALELFATGLDEAALYAVAAADPASLCGSTVTDLPAGLPRRVPGNLVVFHGTRPVLVAERGGKHLTVAVAADDPRLVDYVRRLEPIFAQTHSVAVERINGDRAVTSPYRPAFDQVFATNAGPRALYLERRRSAQSPSE